MPVSRKKYDKILADLASQQTLTRRAREDKAAAIEKLGQSELARKRAGGIIAQLKKAGADLADAALAVKPDGKIGDRREQVSALTDAREVWDETLQNISL